MADLRGSTDSDDAEVDRDRGVAAGTPRWVKVLGVIALALIVLVVVMLLVGGGEHGPGRHTGGGDAAPTGDHTVPAGGHQPPPGGHGP